jgi:hypothetical protein
MTKVRNSPSVPPASDLPLDQTKGPIYYGGGAVQQDFARLWRKVRGLFSARRQSRD